MSPARPLSALLLLLALAHPASAQLTSKQAVAQVKTTGKAQVATFKADAKTALATLDAALEVIEAQLTPDTAATAFGNGVADAAIAFLVTMNSAFLNALDTTSQSAAEALNQLANGGDLAGVYPKSLYLGSGGVLDAHRKAVTKAAGKVRDAAVKRLARSAALAEKQAGLALDVRLALPTDVDATSVNPPIALSLDENARIDLVLAASALDTAGDGIVVIAGTTHDTLDAVTVGYFRQFDETGTDDVTASSVTGRYKAVFTGLVEGGYSVFATQLAGAFDAVAEIGVR